MIGRPTDLSATAGLQGDFRPLQRYENTRDTSSTPGAQWFRTPHEGPSRAGSRCIGAGWRLRRRPTLTRAPFKICLPRDR